MNKQKSILKILFFISLTFLYAQDKDFEKSMSDTEKRIKKLKEAISQNNSEITLLKTKAQQTNNILDITKRTPVLPADKEMSESSSICELIVFHILLFFEFLIEL